MKKVALLFICLNPPYWPYLKDVIEDARSRFLPGNRVDFFVWSDIPDMEGKKSFLATRPSNLQLLKEAQSALCSFVNQQDSFDQKNIHDATTEILSQVARTPTKESCESCIDFLNSQEGITIIPTEPVVWPYPTLMRYHLFLGQEEKLKDYDYLFYLDADMRIVDTVGEEVLGDGLTMAEHPMYSLRKEYVPPYEPNKDSTAFIPRPGIIVDDGGKPRFKPLYAAGGFQGGTSTSFIEAMKEMRKMIDKDFSNNYTAIWNDESYWNRYLFDYKGPITALTPAYVYPDSLIEEYYVKVWGMDYPKKIVTLTKPFTISKEGGTALRDKLKTM